MAELRQEPAETSGYVGCGGKHEATLARTYRIARLLCKIRQERLAHTGQLGKVGGNGDFANHDCSNQFTKLLKFMTSHFGREEIVAVGVGRERNHCIHRVEWFNARLLHLGGTVFQKVDDAEGKVGVV